MLCKAVVDENAVGWMCLLLLEGGYREGVDAVGANKEGTKAVAE